MLGGGRLILGGGDEALNRTVIPFISSTSSTLLTKSPEPSTWLLFRDLDQITIIGVRNML